MRGWVRGPGAGLRRVQVCFRAGSKHGARQGAASRPGAPGTRTKTPLAPAPGRRPAAHELTEELTEELIEVEDCGGPERISRTVNSSSRGRGAVVGWWRWWWLWWLWLVFAILRACRAPQDHALSDVGRATANPQSFRLHPIWITPPHLHPPSPNSHAHITTTAPPPSPLPHRTSPHRHEKERRRN